METGHLSNLGLVASLARGSAGVAVVQIRVSHQPANGQGTWPRGAQLRAITRRRSNRVMYFKPVICCSAGVRSWHEPDVPMGTTNVG
jgi:hypothetical protein